MRTIIFAFVILCFISLRKVARRHNHSATATNFSAKKEQLARDSVKNGFPASINDDIPGTSLVPRGKTYRKQGNNNKEIRELSVKY